MGILATMVILLGGLVGAVGSLWFVINAFRVSIWWGIAVLFLPFAALFFLISNWYDAKRPFLLQLLGTVMVIFGMAMAFNAGARSLPGGMAALEKRLQEELAKQQEGGGPALDLEALKVLTEQAGAPPSRDGAPSERQLRNLRDIRKVDWVGMPLPEVRARLGPPKAEIEADGTVLYFYPGLELESEDGAVVTRQQFAED
ncbi:MAG: hypothetical protein JW951_00790 [Lentisphaerae bacterium]|nr:hypothetical protein [Lentisphaerota bacterium]